MLLPLHSAKAGLAGPVLVPCVAEALPATSPSPSLAMPLLLHRRAGGIKLREQKTPKKIILPLPLAKKIFFTSSPPRIPPLRGGLA